MDIKEEIIPTLSYLGLEKTEALVYLQLLQAGPLTVSTVSKKLEMDRGNVYRALSRLKNLGIVSTTFSNPIVCKAVEPKQAVSEIIQRKKDEIVSMDKISKQIVENLEEVHRSIDSTDDKIKKIAKTTGRESFRNYTLLNTGEFTTKSFLETLDLWLTINRISFEHTITNNDGHQFVVRHDLGEKFSILLNEIVNELVEELDRKYTNLNSTDGNLTFVIDRGA